MTRVLIVDDQAGFRSQLTRLLTLAGFAVVGEASDIPHAEDLVRLLRPTLAVVDVFLPGINGLEGVARLKQLDPALRVILISAHPDRAALFRTAAAAAGAEAFVPKDDLEPDLVRAWDKPVPLA